MTLFRKAAKPVCQEIVTVTTSEVAERIDTKADNVGDILEVGIMAVALVATFFMDRNPVVKAAKMLLIPAGVQFTEFGRF